MTRQAYASVRLHGRSTRLIGNLNGHVSNGKRRFILPLPTMRLTLIGQLDLPDFYFPSFSLVLSTDSCYYFLLLNFKITV